MDWLEEQSFPARPFSPSVKTRTRSELDNNSRPWSIAGRNDFIWPQSRPRTDTFPTSVLTTEASVRSTIPGHTIGYDSSSLICASHVLTGAPKAVTDKLQPVLHAAACVVSGIHKYDRGLSRLLHSELHWLHVSELVAYELRTCRHGVRLTARPSTTVRDRSLSTSLWRLIEAASTICCSTWVVQHIWSTAFSMVSPSVWNLLSDSLRNPAIEEMTSDAFKDALIYTVLKRIRGVTWRYALQIDCVYLFTHSGR